MRKPSEKCEAVRAAWNKCHGAFFQISKEDLGWNCEEQALVRYEGAELAGVPVLWARPTTEGAALGINANGLWLSLFGEVPAGEENAFAVAVEGHARRVGVNRVAVGGDEFHFLPGIPVSEPRGEVLASAFAKNGFKQADCADFIGSTGNPACVEYIRDARATAAARGWNLRLVDGKKDSTDLNEFLENEFPGRWHREWLVWNQRSDTKRAFWNLLRDDGNRVLGFSRLAVRARVAPIDRGWNPGAIRLPLSDAGGPRDTDSCLGPIGISASERGRGAGKVLLGLSLHELSLQGAKQTCIDWTNAYNYYTPLGFEVARRYLSAWKEL